MRHLLAAHWARVGHRTAGGMPITWTKDDAIRELARARRQVLEAPKPGALFLRALRDVFRRPRIDSVNPTRGRK